MRFLVGFPGLGLEDPDIPNRKAGLVFRLSLLILGVA